MTRRAVITGLGIASPIDLGEGKEAFWDGIAGGKDAVKPITLFDASPYSSCVGAEVTSLGMLRSGRWQRLLDTAFAHALSDGRAQGCLNKDNGDNRCALVIGTVLGDILSAEDAWRSGVTPPDHALDLYSGAVGLAKRYGIKGPVTTISTACASGTDSIGMALRLIRSGKSSLVMAGGADTLSEFALSGFNSLNALTKDRVRPFSRNRSGLAPGEGAAFLLIEELEHARRRGARIVSEVIGYGSSADANHLTGPDREGQGLARAMKAALLDAGLESVDYINAHGTATLYNDLMETKAYKSVFGPFAGSIPISSIKSMMGHSFGAAGAIEALTCALVIERSVIPPTINLTDNDPDCDLDYCADVSRKASVRSAMSVSAGFGGQNSAVILRAL